MTTDQVDTGYQVIQVAQALAKGGAGHGALILEGFQEGEEDGGVSGAGEVNGGAHERCADGLPRSQEIRQLFGLEPLQA